MALLGFVLRKLSRAGRMAAVGVAVVSVLALAVLGLGPHTGRYRTATVLSASMRPTIAEGSVVVLTPVPAEQLQVGDVLMYRIPVEDRRVVTHRVVELVERGDRPVVRTKGDANNAPDTWVARLESEPLWQVRAAVPYLGHAVQALRAPQLRLLSIGVVPAVWALLWLRDIWAADKGRRAPAEPVAAEA